jgi:hypothetical protein
MTMRLEDIIRRHVHLPPAESSGFHKVLCPVCHDHGRKGLRAGWKFEGETVGYFCFNCDAAARWERGQRLSKNMRNILHAFGVTDDELREIALESLQAVDFSKVEKKRPSFEPKRLEMPPHFYRLTEAEIDDVWADRIWLYLERRGQNPETFPFYMSKEKEWAGRVILPSFKNGDLIYYQGRDITDKMRLKYLSPNVSKQNILHGFDELWSNRDKPLFVVEGIFDAILINGVAILGNKMSEAQEYWLTSSPRKKVYIPDRWGYGAKNNYSIVERVLELGWSVSLPEFGSDIKDITDAVMRYGRFYTMAAIVDGICSGDLAQMKFKIYQR